MKINHNQILSPSKIKSISSFHVESVIPTGTDSYADALIIDTATNLNELDADDNTFDESSAYTALVSRTSIDDCIVDAAVATNRLTELSTDELLRDAISASQNNITEYIEPRLNGDNDDDINGSAGDDDDEVFLANRWKRYHRGNSTGAAFQRPLLSSQNRFLSLSISPPLTRRQDMPVLRGTFVSL